MRFTRRFVAAWISMGLLGWSIGSAQASASSFHDVPIDYWGFPYIQWASDNGIVGGYPDGNFKPDLAVSQSELLAMLFRAVPSGKNASEAGAASWDTPYLQYAAELGWSDAPLGERQHLSRAAVAQILANAAGKHYNRNDAIQYVLDLGLAQGKTAKTPEGFGPDDQVTRAEAVTFVERYRKMFPQLKAVPAGEQKYDRSEVLTGYYNDKYGFTLYLPKHWEGTYEVENDPQPDGTDSINFIDKANKANGGVVFTISVWAKDKWSVDGKLMTEIVPAYEIGQKGDNVFIVLRPTDVQFNPQDEKLKAEYEAKFNDLRDNKLTFDGK